MKGCFCNFTCIKYYISICSTTLTLTLINLFCLKKNWMQIMVWNFRCEFIGPVHDISFDPSLIIRQSALLGITFNDVTTYFLKSITLSSPYTSRVFGKNFVASMWQVLPPKCSEQHFPVKFSRKGTVHIINMPYSISHLWSKRLISFFGKQELSAESAG